MRYTNTYSQKKRHSRWHKPIRTARISLMMVLLVSALGGRFVLNQIFTSEASAEVPEVAEVAQPQQRAQNETQPIDELEVIPVSTEDDIQEVINAQAAAIPGDVSIVVAAIDGSFRSEVNPGEQYNAASLYKTLAAYKVLQRVDAGQLSLDQQTSAGTSVERCIELAITVSDNPCGIVLQKLAQPFVTDGEAASWGYTQTTLSGIYPQTSARDQDSLLRDIYTGNRLSESSKNLLLQHLSNQEIMDRMPAYEGATVYSKTGDLEGVVHSTAIIELSESVYTISILTDNWSDGILSKYSAIEDIHGEVYKVITQNERAQ